MNKDIRIIDCTYVHTIAIISSSKRNRVIKVVLGDKKFKVGDDVVCVNSNDANYLDFGYMYLIKSIDYGGTHVTLEGRFYRGGESTYSINRFEKIE